jgi:tetratricopeptide (TPR) repeat protein
VLALPRAAAGQAADPKSAFLQNLGQFSVALDGPFGDEGRVARAALDGMARGLDAWDATVRASEAAFAARLPGSSAADAARMHVAIGAAFLDRSRLQDALREFQAGSRLDPGRADVLMFQGLAYDQVIGDVDRAAASFRQAAALDPTNPVLAYLLGRTLSKSGRNAEALQAFQAVLHSPRTARGAPFIRLGLVQERSGVEPFFPPVLYAEGFALLQRGEFANALDAFRRSAAKDPLVENAVDFTDPLGLAASAFRNGDTDAAARYVRVGIEREPTRADAHQLLGRVLLTNRNDEEGLTQLRLAVTLGPGDERAHLALSDALVQLRRYPEAEDAFRAALKALPASGRAHYRLGRLYQRQNKTLEALGEFEAAAKLNPLIGANRLLQTIGALNAAQQNFDAALEAYSTRVDIHPNDADAHRSLGFTYSRLDRREEALAEFTVALWLAPDSPDVHVAMSQLYLKAGDYAAAADAARRAIAINPSNKQARYSLGTALMRLDKPDEATPEFDAFERLQAEDTAAAARQMTINGLRRDASIPALRKVLELAPDAASSHLELGVALVGAGQAAEAVAHLKAAAQLDDSVEAHDSLAAAYAALGQPGDSARELAASRLLRRAALLRETDR